MLHTGDWKIDPTPILGVPTDEAKLRALGEEGCLALVGDSTNAVREGRSPSEADVAKTIAELIRSAPRRVAVTTFASNVARLRAVADAARAADRDVVVVGRAMERIVQVARETGYLEGVQAFRSAGRSTAICRPTRSWRSAPAARASRAPRSRASPRINIRTSRCRKGDLVIFSARTIPGNEKAVGRVLNGLIDQGIEVITDRTHLVHVSGHPRRDELRELIGWVKPQILIPAHGEAFHLHEHAGAGAQRRRAER